MKSTGYCISQTLLGCNHSGIDRRFFVANEGIGDVALKVSALKAAFESHFVYGRRRGRLVFAGKELRDREIPYFIEIEH